MSFFEIFNPGERYLREEQDRRKMLVSKPTHGGGAPLGIDLDGGKATITIRIPSGPETDTSPDVKHPPEAPEPRDASTNPRAGASPDTDEVSEAGDVPDTGEAPYAGGTRS